MCELIGGNLSSAPYLVLELPYVDRKDAPRCLSRGEVSRKELSRYEEDARTDFGATGCFGTTGNWLRGLGPDELPELGFAYDSVDDFREASC